MRWWKTRKNPKGVKKREKKSRDKIVEIITVENNISKMMSDKHILSKIKSNLGVSSDAKVDIVILDILSQIPLGISNDVY